MLLASGVVTVLSLSPPATRVEAQNQLVGQRSPAVHGSTITGQPFSLASLAGHFVVPNGVILDTVVGPITATSTSSPPRRRRRGGELDPGSEARRCSQ